ncbi:MAG: hypothetical protein IJS28_07155 [Synergistaceae bacterium]|nr:hypothetical protein [Synergistaceae bacterium]
MYATIRSFVKVMQRRQRLGFRLRNVILRDNLEGLSKAYKGGKRRA